MIDPEDLTPPRPRKPYEPLVLDGWADRELNAYLEHLHEEIARVRQTLEAKRSMRGAAEGLFKS